MCEDDDELEAWIILQAEDEYVESVAPAGPDEYSVGHAGEWNHHDE